MKRTNENTIETGNAKLVFNAKEGMVRSYTHDGELFRTNPMTQEGWNNISERMVKTLSIKPKSITPEERRELAIALSKAVDWKEARRIKLKLEEENKNK